MTISQELLAFLAILLVQLVTGSSLLLLGRQGKGVLRALPFFVSGAAGVLMATACLDLLPDAARATGPTSTMWSVFLVTLLLLFCFQSVLRDDDAHDPLRAVMQTSLPEPSTHALHSFSSMHDSTSNTRGLRTVGAAPLLLGSALHSGVDGLVIAAAFAAGRVPGWSAAVAVGLHEMPHRLGDYSLLLHKGFTRQRALELAIGAGGTAFVGGLAVTIFGHYAQAARWLLPVSAASFLYIALVDLLPEIQAHKSEAHMGWQIACLFGGAMLIAAAIHFSGE